MKKGFTLIELLAVILILGIIALIAIPTVNNIIKETKEEASKRIAENYIVAIENQVVLSKTSDILTTINDGEYSVNNLTDLGVTLKGQYTIDGIVTIENGLVIEAEVRINGYDISCDSNRCVVGDIRNTVSIVVNNGESSNDTISIASTGKFTITPNEGFYLKEINCTNGYTVSPYISEVEYTESQEITVYNSNSGDDSICTVSYKATPIFLYKDGVINSLAGNFNTAYSSKSSYSYGSMTKEATKLHYYRSNSNSQWRNSGFSSTKKVDITDYDTLTFYFDTSSYMLSTNSSTYKAASTTYLGLSSDYSSNGSTSEYGIVNTGLSHLTLSTTEEPNNRYNFNSSYDVDISDITGEYYIVLGTVDGYWMGQTWDLKVTGIELK